MTRRTVEFAKIDDTTEFAEPQKLINSEADVQTFSTSVAYARITAFIHFLSDVMPDTALSRPPRSSPAIETLLEVLKTCQEWMEKCPPHTGPRRFGNLAFREWHVLLNKESQALLSTLIPQSRHSSLVEALPYFLGSFGSAQRLDYGTGHELSFIAFICCLYQLDIFTTSSKEDAQCIGLVVYPAYLRIIQTLIVRYTLEPAGSHGVWGLDDHFAMPYLLGAAQLSNLESGVHPLPSSITTPRDVKELRSENLYFNAIGFINDVKKGPFWEHSPMLYDISGIDGWAKISSGMKKMYNVEVLGKFPVVQHFPFGPIFFPFGAQNDAKSSPVADNAAADLKDVRDRTQKLHASEYERDRAALNADTPVPDDNPTHTSRMRNAMPPPSSMPPTTAPWKRSQTQVSTAAPWTTSTARHSSNGSDRLTNQMGSMRTTQVRREPDINSSPQPQEVRPTSSGGSDPKSQQKSQNEEANTDGLEDGIGVDGMPGTKAPFATPRTIHPTVLASMQARGEVIPETSTKHQ